MASSVACLRGNQISGARAIDAMFRHGPLPEQTQVERTKIVRGQSQDLAADPARVQSNLALDREEPGPAPLLVAKRAEPCVAILEGVSAPDDDVPQAAVLPVRAQAVHAGAERRDALLLGPVAARAQILLEGRVQVASQLEAGRRRRELDAAANVPDRPI